LKILSPAGYEKQISWCDPASGTTPEDAFKTVIKTEEIRMREDDPAAVLVIGLHEAIPTKKGPLAAATSSA